MNTNCVICSDLFTPSDEISTTRCGHIFHHVCLLQWLERSPTCPQCRKKTTSSTIIRTYFNYTNSEGVTLDAGALQNKLDFAELQLKERGKEISKLKDENETLQNNLNEAESVNKSLESNVKEKTASIKMMKEHIEYLKTDSKEISKLRSENQDLKNKIDNLKCLQDIIEGTKSEVEAMVQNMPDVNKLSTYIVILKKSVVKSESKKKSLQEDVRCLQSRLQKMDSEKGDLLSKIKLLESSVTFLEEQNKIKSATIPSNQSIKSTDDKIDKDKSSPCNKNEMKFMNKTENIIDLSPSVSNEKKSTLASISQKLILNSDNQTNSTSPYLNLKQSNNLYIKLQSKSKSENNIKPKLHNFYILKDTKNCDKFNTIKNGQMFKNMAQKRKQMDTVYDGLGGHFKPDVFPGTSNVKTINNTSPLNILKKTKTFK